MSDIVFADGLIVKMPSEKAPDFVMGKLSFKLEEFIPFLQANAKDGWVNLDLLVGKSGKPYAKLDDFKPEKREAPTRNVSGRRSTPPPPPPQEEGEELPF